MIDFLLRKHILDINMSYGAVSLPADPDEQDHQDMTDEIERMVEDRRRVVSVIASGLAAAALGVVGLIYRHPLVAGTKQLVKNIDIAKQEEIITPALQPASSELLSSLAEVGYQAQISIDAQYIVKEKTYSVGLRIVPSVSSQSPESADLQTTLASIAKALGTFQTAMKGVEPETRAPGVCTINFKLAPGNYATVPDHTFHALSEATGKGQLTELCLQSCKGISVNSLDVLGGTHGSSGMTKLVLTDCPDVKVVPRIPSLTTLTLDHTGITAAELIHFLDWRQSQQHSPSLAKTLTIQTDTPIPNTERYRASGVTVYYPSPNEEDFRELVDVGNPL